MHLHVGIINMSSSAQTQIAITPTLYRSNAILQSLQGFAFGLSISF